jgi:hypothetical protein
MTVHLIKLAVGAENIGDLVHWQAERLAAARREKRPAELVHITRQTPKRSGELLDGGSLYWVIKGMVCARQRLIELRPLDRDGIPHCGLVYSPELVRTHPRPHRPFQGWRYLAAKDAPPDLRSGEEAMSEGMQRELAELGLL